MSITNDIIKIFNTILGETNRINIDKYEQMMYNKLSLIKEAIKEIVLAVQLAKKGIVNSNLLDRSEIRKILKETDTLPYSNEIEAVEYAEPSMITKDWTLLYVLSIPKTSSSTYDHIITRAITKNNRRLYLKYDEILKHNKELFGIKQKCNEIKNTTICKLQQIEKIQHTECINNILQGSDIGCQLQYNSETTIEDLDEGTLFLANFNGLISNNESSKHIDGSFIVKYNNESIKIGDREFVNWKAVSSQVLPPVFQFNSSESSFKLDSGYIHILHLNNTRELRHLQRISTSTHIGIISIILIVLIIYIVLRYRRATQKTTKLNLPRVLACTTST